jgi:predicted SAM-dependent methyltransferase
MADASLPAGKTVLNVGCGYPLRQKLHRHFHGPEWREVRLDLDPAVQPDIVCSITDMSPVATASVDAVWSSHNLEHLQRHEVPLALAEFIRVLKPQGLLLLTLPDLRQVAQLVVEDRLEDEAYTSPSGADHGARHDLRAHRLTGARQPIHGAPHRFYRADTAQGAGGSGLCRHHRAPRQFLRFVGNRLQACLQWGQRMNFLFIHQNFPGQFVHVVRYLVQAGHQVNFITQPRDAQIAGVRKLEYRPELPQSYGHDYLPNCGALLRTASRWRGSTNG